MLIPAEFTSAGRPVGRLLRLCIGVDTLRRASSGATRKWLEGGGPTVRERVRRLTSALVSRISRNRQLGPSGVSAPEPPNDSPLLSVVVVGVGSAAAQHLAECMDSLKRQKLRRLEIILVADALGASSPEVGVFAARDPRVVVLTAPSVTVGAARNAGAAGATAPYLAFLDAADTVPADGYQLLVDVLTLTGSDFAAGAVRRDRNGRRSTPAWSSSAHREPRLATTVEATPVALQDLFLGNRVFRRDFWRDAVGPVPLVVFDDRVPRPFWNERMAPYGEGVAYDDHVPALAASLRASTFDLITPVTCIWRVSERAGHVGTSPEELGELTARATVLHEARQLVEAQGTARAASAWTARVLGVELPVLVRHALAAGDTYRSIVSGEATDLLARADASALASTPVDRKLLVALAAAGRWDDADRLLETVRLDGPIPPTSVVDGRVYADLPFGSGFASELYELSQDQTRVAVVIDGVSWDRAGTLTIDGFALVRGVDQEDACPDVEIVLVPVGDSEDIIRLDVAPRAAPDATLWADHPWQSYDRAGFRVHVPATAIHPTEPAGPRSAARRWQLRVRVRVRDVEREGVARTLTRFGTADRMPSSPVTDPFDPWRIFPSFDDDEGFTLQVRSDVARAVTLASTPDGALSGVIRLLSPLTKAPAGVALADARGSDWAPVIEGADGTFAFSFATPPTGPGTRSLRLITERGRANRVGWPQDDTTPPLVRAGDRDPGWQRSPRGNVQVLAPRPRCQLQGIELTGEHLRLTVTTEQLTAADLQTAALVTSVTTIAASSVEGQDGRWLIEFALSAPAWPRGSVRPLPSGRYDLTVQRGGRALAVTAGIELLNRLPIEQLGAWHGLTVHRAPRSTRIHLSVRAPLAEGERARVDQHRLQRRYAGTEHELVEQAFFQCYRGESVTDSQLALHTELRRRDAAVEVVWGIADWSVELPDGARGVIVGSREWYEALGSSRYLCSNIEFDRFLRRRPHQRYLQTFHGYPFKSMGIPFWRSKGFSERAISEECDRRNRAWTSIVVPAPFCVDLYRECYRYEGEILVTGYPRDDALVRPDPGVRDQVLTRLGVPAGRRVVLYAPTWRESDAITARKAKLFDELEVDRLADALGADHTILLRGHTRTRHTSGAGPAGRAEILDVTRYPEINDLILAADVAVLDYSSLRFDWLLTGKPVLFFVPDLESYLAQRTALFDFGPTAPGPLLGTTAEVIDALRDLERVSAAFVAQRTEANARFNALNDGFAAARVADAFFADTVSTSD